MGKFKCVKCGCTEFTEDQFQATGSDISKLLDVQSKKFITISCKECGYTELYKSQTSTGMNVLDLFFGS